MLRFFSLIAFIVFSVLDVWAGLNRADAVNDMPYLVMPELAANNEKSFSEEVLPKSMTEADSSQSVVSKIIDNSLSYWWNHSELKQTSVGRAAEQVQNHLKGEVNFNTGEAKTEHKISFKLLAMQALAKIEYSGWIQAAFHYDIKAAKAEAEIVESLSSNKDLLLSHSIAENESESKLSLRWKW